MQFYATLLITSLVLTLVIIGLKNLIVFVARKAYGLGKRHVKAGRTRHIDQETADRDPIVAPSPWGRQAHATPAKLAKTHPAATQNTPWGWPGNGHVSHEKHPKPATLNEASLSAYLARKHVKQQSVMDWKRNVGRPVRDGSSALSGTAHKPSEEVTSRYGVDKKRVRPWGW